MMAETRSYIFEGRPSCRLRHPFLTFLFSSYQRRKFTCLTQVVNAKKIMFFFLFPYQFNSRIDNAHLARHIT